MGSTSPNSKGGDQVGSFGFGLNLRVSMAQGENTHSKKVLQTFSQPLHLNDIGIHFPYWRSFPYMQDINSYFPSLPELKVAPLNPSTFRTLKPPELLAKNPNSTKD